MVEIELTTESILKRLDDNNVIFLDHDDDPKNSLVLMRSHTFHMYKDIIESLVDPTVSLQSVRDLLRATQ